MGTGVGSGVGTGVGACVGTGVGSGVGTGVGACVGSGVGTGVGACVGTGVGACVGTSVGTGVEFSGFAVGGEEAAAITIFGVVSGARASIPALSKPGPFGSRFRCYSNTGETNHKNNSRYTGGNQRPFRSALANDIYQGHYEKK